MDVLEAGAELGTAQPQLVLSNCPDYTNPYWSSSFLFVSCNLFVSFSVRSLINISASLASSSSFHWNSLPPLGSPILQCNHCPLKGYLAFWQPLCPLPQVLHFLSDLRLGDLIPRSVCLSVCWSFCPPKITKKNDKTLQNLTKQQGINMNALKRTNLT